MIDRPVSYDIYRNVHKGIRLEMFAVTTELGSLDPDDTEACRRFASRFRILELLLTKHAMHEDVHLEPAIAEALGDHAAQLAVAHVVLESQVERIGRIVDAALAAAGADRRAALHMAYLELAAFVGAYLQHQDDEERIVMRALDAAFPTEVLAQLDAAIVASIPPEILGQFLAIMLPGDERPRPLRTARRDPRQRPQRGVRRHLGARRPGARAPGTTSPSPIDSTWRSTPRW